MKKFLNTIIPLLASVCDQIHQNELPLSGANGKTWNESKDGISEKQAQRILSNYKAYQRESKQFKTHQEVITIPKVFLVHLLLPRTTLCLITGEETRNPDLNLSKKTIAKLNKLRPKSALRFILSLITVILVGMIVIMILLPDTEQNILPFRIIIVVICILVYQLITTLLSLTRNQNKHYESTLKQVKDEIKTLRSDDEGYNDSSDFDTQITCKSLPDLTTIANKAIKYHAELAFIVDKRDMEVKIHQLDEKVVLEIIFNGPVIPVLMRQNTLIFYEEFLDAIENPLRGHFEIKDALQPLENQIKEKNVKLFLDY